eukprot:PhM_4_TR12003/c0_g1_i1/m.52674
MSLDLSDGPSLPSSLSFSNLPGQTPERDASPAYSSNNYYDPQPQHRQAPSPVLATSGRPPPPPSGRRRQSPPRDVHHEPPHHGYNEHHHPGQIGNSDGYGPDEVMRLTQELTAASEQMRTSRQAWHRHVSSLELERRVSQLTSLQNVLMTKLAEMAVRCSAAEELAARYLKERDEANHAKDDIMMRYAQVMKEKEQQQSARPRASHPYNPPMLSTQKQFEQPRGRSGTLQRHLPRTTSPAASSAPGSRAASRSTGRSVSPRSTTTAGGRGTSVAYGESHLGEMGVRARIERCFAPRPTPEQMSSVVDAMVVELKQSLQDDGIVLPLRRVGRCVYTLGEKRVNLQVSGGRLVVKAGGGNWDFFEYITKTGAVSGTERRSTRTKKR